MVQSQPVQAFMTTPVKFVRPDTALTDVIQMLNAAHISGLAVCDDQGRLVGEISTKDLMVRSSWIASSTCAIPCAGSGKCIKPLGKPLAPS